MRICIFGAGAIGGTIGARLAQAGHEVSLVARGAHLAAIRAHGLTLRRGDASHVLKLAASDNPADLGVQDAVIIALKSHSLPAAVAGIAPLLGPDTCVVSALNGLPWWFFNDWGGALSGTPLVSCDPDGRIAAAIEPARVLGCVVFLAADVPAPGVVRHNSGNRLVLGEPGNRLVLGEPANRLLPGESANRLVPGESANRLVPGEPGSRLVLNESANRISTRVTALAAALTEAGFEAQASDNIRRDMWQKLLGNLCFNPASVLTGVSTDQMLDDDHMSALFAAMMREAIAVAAALGIDIEIDPAVRMAQTRKLGPIRSSMLQDVEAGRPIELDAIVGSVVEVAERVGVPTPFINAVFGAVRVRARALGLYPKP